MLKELKKIRDLCVTYPIMAFLICLNCSLGYIFIFSLLARTLALFPVAFAIFFIISLLVYRSFSILKKYNSIIKKYKQKGKDEVVLISLNQIVVYVCFTFIFVGLFLFLTYCFIKYML